MKTRISALDENDDSKVPVFLPSWHGASGLEQGPPLI